MPFPAGLTLVTVHGQLDTLPNGGAAGMVRFVSPSALQGSVDNSIVPYVDVTVGLDSSGEFTTQLPATDATGWSPTGWAYTVTMSLGVRTVAGTLQLAAANTSVELADLFQPDGATDTGQTYILIGQKGVYGGVAALDASTGEVLDGDGNAVGGGGGGTASGTVVSETSYGQSATAGAATAYSRGDHTHGTPALGAITITESQVTNLVSDLAAKAPLASPTFTGTPSLPTGTTGVTQSAADSSTKLATTAFATGAVSDHVAAANPHTQYKRTYVESAGTYAVSTTARDFVGTDDPAGKGFTLVAGDKWYAI